MKEFNILSFKSEKEIKSIINSLSDANLTITSHGFETYGKIKIGVAAKQSINNYTYFSKKRPAVALLDVVLAANRNYNKVVEPNISRIKKDSNIVSFKDLESFIKSKSKADFFVFWGHKDDKKFKTLCGILFGINNLRKKYPDSDDYKIMNRWAKDANYYLIEEDEIGKIKNVGLATFQHLRMVFGANTVKPDQRVIEILENEFDTKKISQINSIKAVEQIAKIINKTPLEVDQIFVKYGSGYYNKVNIKINEDNLRKVIANKLVKLGVSKDIILKATKINL